MISMIEIIRIFHPVAEMSQDYDLEEDLHCWLVYHETWAAAHRVVDFRAARVVACCLRW